MSRHSGSEACKQKQCAQGSACISFNLTEEGFCATDCTGTGKCDANYSCYKVSASASRCGPTAPDKQMPTCTTLTKVGNPGDIMEDFAVVGFRDTNDDHSLVDEKLGIHKLSDFKDKKIILLNVSAFW